jgi:predicted transcriptional regulator
MPRRRSENPTELELAILKVLWQTSPRVVEEVREALAAAGRELTYSTVVTMMNIMVKKKLLQRNKTGRALEYSPLVDEQGVHRRVLGDVLNRVFDGSASAVMLELLETADIDAAELNEIRKLIARKARELKQ